MTAAGKFTPGPWATDPETEHQSVLGPDGFMVADCAIFGFGKIAKARSEGVCQENARLVSAAPEMLAALKRCEAMVSTDQGPPNWDWVREVIAKAVAS